jgi:hypothetical protein
MLLDLNLDTCMYVDYEISTIKINVHPTFFSPYMARESLQIRACALPPNNHP